MHAVDRDGGFLKKLSYLESLRGLAALIVVIGHFIVGFYPALYTGSLDQVHTRNGIEVLLSVTPLSLLYNGTFSVAIFFVLSGYVLTYKFFKNSNAEVFLVPLTIKRYVRLLLPILFSNLAAYLLLSLSLFYNKPASEVSFSLGWLSRFWDFTPRAWTMLRESFYGAFFTNQATYNTVLWTMYFEFFGSLIVFAFIAFFGRSQKRYICYIIAILLFRHSHYLAFILGMLLSDLSTRQDGFFIRTNNNYLFVLLLVLGLFLGSYPDGRPVDGSLYEFMKGLARVRTYYIVGATLVMIALLKLTWLQSFLSLKPFVLLGRISFSLYALHLLLIGSLSSYLLLRFTPYFSYHVAFALMFLISLPTILIAAYFMERTVDTTGIGLSQWIYQQALKKMNRMTGSLSSLLSMTLRKNNGPAPVVPAELAPAPAPSKQGCSHDV